MFSSSSKIVFTWLSGGNQYEQHSFHMVGHRTYGLDPYQLVDRIFGLPIFGVGVDQVINPVNESGMTAEPPRVIHVRPFV